ncbi:PaaI family thioesterase [Verticiella sediminum]|uniref:PaaI family thioesterase n=1 Tax=Verticiella sediminum TaxID=1247510 RepID=A0A556AY86_9BURK|nr:PaaI family thioesterase [Verticiella sediminum]TSH97913.1 PaaI family thioesterase [Verticiella sediminum]
MDQDAYFWQIQSGRIPQPPAAHTLGMTITAVDAASGTLQATFEGKAAFANPAGHIQGGFLSAMLDDTMGPALAATLAAGEFAPTLQLNVQFLSPAVPGVLHGTGRVLRRGGQICFLAGELAQDGRLVATATATAAIRRL